MVEIVFETRIGLDMFLVYKGPEKMVLRPLLLNSEDAVKDLGPDDPGETEDPRLIADAVMMAIFAGTGQAGDSHQAARKAFLADFLGPLSNEMAPDRDMMAIARAEMEARAFHEEIRWVETFGARGQGAGKAEDHPAPRGKASPFVTDWFEGETDSFMNPFEDLVEVTVDPALAKDKDEAGVPGPHFDEDAVERDIFKDDDEAPEIAENAVVVSGWSDTPADAPPTPARSGDAPDPLPGAGLACAEISIVFPLQSGEALSKTVEVAVSLGMRVNINPQDSAVIMDVRSPGNGQHEKIIRMMDYLFVNGIQFFIRKRSQFMW